MGVEAISWRGSSLRLSLTPDSNLSSKVQTSEAFSTAGRTVKSGLVAAAVVSSWTWAATLLQSSGVAYSYGVSGPFWYASGATVQILLFATLAIEYVNLSGRTLELRWGVTDLTLDSNDVLPMRTLFWRSSRQDMASSRILSS